MLEMLNRILQDSIGEMSVDHFYNYEEGLQSLLVKKLLLVENFKVTFESRLENGRKADILVLHNNELSAIELKFFSEYRPMKANEAAAMLYDIIIAKSHLDKQIKRGNQFFMFNENDITVSNSYAVGVIQIISTNLFHNTFNTNDQVDTNLSYHLNELYTKINYEKKSNHKYRLIEVEKTIIDSLNESNHCEFGNYFYYIIEFRN